MRPAGGREAGDRERGLSLVPVSHETAARLDLLAGELARWQRVKNLVGPGTLEHVWTRHIADSAQLVDLAPGARRWLDLGSGAGFPGLVVAIMLTGQPGAHVDLVESNSRKCAFLRSVVRQTGAPAAIHEGRIETIIPRFVGRVDVVTARALASLPELLAMTKDLLRTGAVGIFPKGRDVEAELTAASKSWRIEALPSKTDRESRILVVRRVSEGHSGHD